MKQGIMKTVCSLWLIGCSVIHAGEQAHQIINIVAPFNGISSTAAIISSSNYLPEQLADPINVIMQAIQHKHIEPALLSKAVQDLGGKIGWCLPRQYVECCILAHIIQNPEKLDYHALASKLANKYKGFLGEAAEEQAVYDLDGWDKKLVVDNTDGILKQEARKIFCKHPTLTWQESTGAKTYPSRDLTPIKEIRTLAWIFFDRTFLKEEEQEEDFKTFFSYTQTGFQDSPKGIQAIITSIGGHFGWDSDTVKSQVDMLNGQLFNLKESTK
jgi:hypothetical protein